MTVEVQLATRPAPARERIAAWAASAMDGDARALCVRVVGEREGAALNQRFRGRAGTTNVLAFPARQTGLLGDLAVCAPLATREAAEQGKTDAEHFAHLVVHGVLHLLGMDHDTDASAAAMESKEAQVLARFGIANPYGERA